MHKKFKSLDEVRAYVSGETIQCLVCGKHLRRLQFKHLESHGMTADDYRERFGIPWNTSLTSAPSRAATGKSVSPERIEAFKQVRKTRGTTRRPSAPAVRNAWKASAAKGRYFAKQPVKTSCDKCGALVKTTALTAVQPIHCDQCASPGALKTRRYYRRKKRTDL